MELSTSYITIPLDALISFHSQERSLFKRLVFELEVDYVLAMGVISFWMWLESIGHPSFIECMATMSNETLQRIVVEGETCLTAILIDASDPLAVVAKRDVLTMLKASGSPIDLWYFQNFWESARDGVTSILNNICPKIFRDFLSFASSWRMSHDTQGVINRSTIDMLKEGKNTTSMTRDSRIQNQSGILGRYDGGRSKSLLNRSRSPSKEGIDMPLREDASFIPYGEGSSRSPCSDLQLPLHGDDDVDTKGCQEMVTSKSRLLSNMLNFQQGIQANYLEMLVRQNFNMPCYLFNEELDIGGLSISPRTMTPINSGINQALGLNHHMGSATKSLPSCSLTHQRSNINPLALTWTPMERDIPQDERTLFITFSNGYPLGERDLLEFFTRHYGGIEMIHIQEVKPDEQPLYARIAFYLQATCLLVLNGNEKAKFVIKGRHVWVRRYVPKRKQPRRAHHREK